MKPTKSAAAGLVIAVISVASLPASAAGSKLEFKPHRLSFGRGEAGTISAPKIVTVSRRAGDALSIETISASNQFSASQNCVGSVPAKPESCQISVTFDPVTPANPKGTNVKGQLTILAGVGGDPPAAEYTVKLAGVAFGTAPVGLTNTVYVANSANNTVTSYAAGSIGNAAPNSAIGGSNTFLNSPAGIALDSTGNIFVANATGLSFEQEYTEPLPGPNFYEEVNGNVTEYAAGSTGNVAPVPASLYFNTDLGSYEPLFADSWNLCVGNTPNLAVDASGHFYAAGADNHDGCAACYTFSPISGCTAQIPPIESIDIFQSINITRISNGCVPGIGSSCDDAAGVEAPSGVALDSSGDIYVTNRLDQSPGFSPCASAGQWIGVYPAADAGDVPVAYICGSNTGLNYGFGESAGIALDSSGKIYVGSGENTINVYPPLSSVLADPAYPNISPIATIAGSNTGLGGVAGIALDAHGDIYVTNSKGGTSGAGSITEYAPRSHGNVKPIATIEGNLTGLSGPIGIAIGQY